MTLNPSSLECMDFMYNGIQIKNPGCSNLVVLGRFSFDELKGYDEVVVIGTGRVDNVSVGSLIVVSRGGPVLIKRLECNNCIADGAIHPVVILDARCNRLLARNAIMGEIEAVDVVLNERCIVKRIRSVKSVVFRDPYVWFEEIHGERGVDFKLLYNTL